MKCSDMLTEKVRTGEPLTSEDISLCLGLESLISRDVPRRIQQVKMMRTMHIQVILEAQDHQMCTVEFLARSSEISSLPARERSHKFACASLRVPD